MDFETFKKYKKLAEMSSDTLSENSSYAEVKDWVENERLNESIWTNVWAFLKKNFSPTARKLHNLADEFEKETEEELRAEYEHGNSKKIIDKMRTSYGSKLSNAIRDKMNIIAGEDQTYRDLANELIIKKTYDINKKLLDEFRDKIDTDEVAPMKKFLEDGSVKADKNISKHARSVVGEPSEIRPVSDAITKVVKDSKEIKVVFSDKRENVDQFIPVMISYLQKMGKDTRLEINTAVEATKNLLKDSAEIFGRIKQRDKNVSNETLSSALRKSIEQFLSAEKPVKVDKNVIMKMTDEALKEKENDKSSDISSDELKDAGVLTDHTADVAEPSEIKASVADAEKKAEEATPEAVSDEIADRVKSYFETNKKDLFDRLNVRIENANNPKINVPGYDITKHNYNLVDGKIPSMKDPKDLEKLYSDLVSIYGEILPYTIQNENNKMQAIHVLSKYLFEIYAKKKDPSGKLSNDDRKKIIEDMKAVYLQSKKEESKK